MASSSFKFFKMEQSTGFLLWQVTNLWQREIRKALETYDLTHSQFVILANILYLQEKQHQCTQILISTTTKIDPMTTSAILKTLETKNFILRKENPLDTRAKLVHLTDLGSRITKQAVNIVEGFDEKFFESLGSKVNKFNSLLNNLQKQNS